MLQTRSLCGGQWWKLSLIVCGEFGVLRRLWGPWERGCGNIIGGVEEISLELLDMSWEMGTR